MDGFAQAGAVGEQPSAPLVSSSRVGVLTFHRCINYGSYWQARCLVEGLRGSGRDAVLLDHDSPPVNRAEWRCALQPELPVRSSAADMKAYAAKTRRFLDVFGRLPLSQRFSLDEPDTLEEFDAIVVGSDEVWNLRHPWYGGHPVFYGSGLKARRLVSYAASFGNQNASEGLPHYWAEKLREFERISVRDHNSAALVGEALGEEPELVLDPCLQFPPALTEEKASDPYMAIYGHSFPGWFREAVKCWASLRQLRMVSIGYRNEWADDNRLSADPQSYARLMASASAVATNFFHGFVFALLARAPFVCVASDYRSNKVRDLARLLGAQQHLVGNGRQVAEMLSAPLEETIFERIAAMRRRSSAYLESALA